MKLKDFLCLKMKIEKCEDDPPGVLPEMAGHLGQGLGAEGALLRLCLRAEECHPLHFSHIELNKKKMGTTYCTHNQSSGSASVCF
jgi:hypothetical protein